MPLKKKKKKAVATKKKTIKKAAAKKKIVRKKAVKKIAKKKAVAIKKVKETVIGIVTHYFPHVKAAVVKLKAPLAIGGSIKVKGHTTDFKQTVTSLQIDRTPLDSAKKGDEVGLLVNSRVRRHDVVYKA